MKQVQGPATNKKGMHKNCFLRIKEKGLFAPNSALFTIQLPNLEKLLGKD